MSAVIFISLDYNKNQVEYVKWIKDFNIPCRVFEIVKNKRQAANSLNDSEPVEISISAIAGKEGLFL
jgi:hypothetical protein